MSNPLLGFVTTEHGTSKDEQDNLDRSAKKVKDNIHISTPQENATKGNQSLQGARSDKTTMLGDDSTMKDSEGSGIMGSSDEDDLENIEDEEESIRVEEMKLAGYDCPIFHLSKKEELRIQKPWKRGIIVKMLGRRIGYKALENRLKQMWVKAGVINIVDLGNDYFLVTFTSQEDQHHALTNGPWLIYDHYLTVREWCPNFNPSENHLKKVTVWVRFSGLPIEFYDAKVLTSIGNRIGRTVKVDKNTLLQERGKYARLCVEVDLSKPLLAMFSVKGRTYKVEYEGLHLLCLGCGKFGHYVEGCPEKVKNTSSASTTKDGTAQDIAHGENEEGPWTVVSKPRRQKKASKLAEDNKKGEAVTGSRFAILGTNQTHQEGEISIENNEEVLDGGKEIINTVPKVSTPRIEGEDSTRGSQSIKKEKSQIQDKNQGAMGKSLKDNKLATRGTATFKGKSGQYVKKGPDVITKRMMTNTMQGINVTEFGKVTKGGDEVVRDNLNSQEGVVIRNEGVDNGGRSIVETTMGPTKLMIPNMSRPPDSPSIPILTPSSNETLNKNPTADAENVVDSIEQRDDSLDTEEMEYVSETPDLQSHTDC
jgi:hypothetical protein